MINEILIHTVNYLNKFYPNKKFRFIDSLSIENNVILLKGRGLDCFPMEVIITKNDKLKELILLHNKIIKFNNDFKNWGRVEVRFRGFSQTIDIPILYLNIDDKHYYCTYRSLDAYVDYDGREHDIFVVGDRYGSIKLKFGYDIMVLDTPLNIDNTYSNFNIIENL